MRLETKLTAGALVVLAAVFTFGLSAFAAQETCPETGKVESQVDGDLDDIVLESGTLVCIKGGQAIVTVTADGVATLADLLDTGQNVSHYTVLEVPSSTTTTTNATTTTQAATTTTGDPSTTTSSAVTTTSQGSTTTTDTPISTTTPRGTTTAPPAGNPPATLPYTGPLADFGLAALAGAALTALGVILVRSRHE